MAHYLRGDLFMNSLELYKAYKEKFSSYDPSMSTRNDFNKLMKMMACEINHNGSSKLVESMRMDIYTTNLRSEFGVINIFMIIFGLYSFLNDEDPTTKEEWSKYRKYLYTNSKYKDIDSNIRLMNNSRNTLKKIDDYRYRLEYKDEIDSLKKESDTLTGKINDLNTLVYQKELEQNELQGIIKNLQSKIESKDSVINDLRKSNSTLQYSVESLQNDINSLKNDKAILEDKINSINNAPILEAQRQITLRARERRIQIGQGLLNWQEQQKETHKCLIPIQKDIQDSLKLLREFETKQTNDYVLRFANIMLNIYNDIHSCYESQCRIKESWDNPNYHNAVNNYQVFLDEISDELYGFGIEDLFSSTNEPFDSKIHEVVDAGGINLRHAVVVESIRAGFRYNDIILQKERVRVREDMSNPEVIEPKVDLGVVVPVSSVAVESEILNIDNSNSEEDLNTEITQEVIEQSDIVEVSEPLKDRDVLSDDVKRDNSDVGLELGSKNVPDDDIQPMTSDAQIDDGRGGHW